MSNLLIPHRGAMSQSPKAGARNIWMTALRRSMAACCLLGSLSALSGAAHAASQVWSPTPADANFNNPANYVGNAVPGVTTTATPAAGITGDVVTYNSTPNPPFGLAANPIVIDLGRNVAGLTFDTANAGPFVIGSTGGNILLLSQNGTTQVTATVVNPQQVNAPINFRLPSSTDGVYTINSNSTTPAATLTFNGTIQNQNTSRPIALTLGGANIGDNLINGVITTTGTNANSRFNLTKSGAGKWILAQNNVLNAGTGTNATITITGGTLQIGNGGATGTLGLAAATAVTVTSPGTLSFNRNDTVTLTNPITGTGILSQIGIGTLILTGANTYSGGTFIGSGSTLQVGNAGTVGALGTGTITDNGTLVFNRTNAVTVAGNITGNGGLTQNGTSSVTLTAATSDYTGTTAINSGSLKFNGAKTGTGPVTVSSGASLSGIGSVAGTTTVAGGSVPVTQGAVDLRDVATGTLTLGNLTVGDANGPASLYFDVGGSGVPPAGDKIAVTGNLTVNPGGAAIRLTNLGNLAGGQSYTLVTFASGTGVTQGTGTQVGNITLDTSVFSFGTTGTITVGPNSIVLNVSGAAVPPTAYFTGAVGSALNSNDGTNSNFTLDAAGTMNTGALPGASTDVFFTADNAATNFTTTLGQDFTIKSLTFRGTGPASSNPVVIGGANTLTINNGINVETGNAGSTVSAPVALGAGQTWTNNSTTVPLVISGNVSGNGPLTKAGPGLVTLGGANTYSGGTIISEGRLLANNAGAIPSGSLSTPNSAALSVTNGLVLTASLAVNNVANIEAPTTASSSTTANFSGFNGALTGNGTVNLFVPGNKTDLLGNWSAFTGQINITVPTPVAPATTGGDARFANFNNQVFNNSKVNLGDGAFLYQNFNPPSGSGTETVQAIGELSGTATSRLGGNPVGGRFVNYSIGSLNTSSTFAGVIQDGTGSGGVGATRLTKVGTGTLTLAGTNTYTGATTISGGMLIVTGSAANSPVTVPSGATLMGTGTVGPTTINSGGVHAPGLSPGIQTINGAYNMVGTLQVELGGTSPATTPGTGYDQVLAGGAGNGNVTLSGTIAVTPVNSFTPAAGNTFVIVVNTGSGTTTVTSAAPSGFLLQAVEYDPATNTITNSSGGNDVALAPINTSVNLIAFESKQFSDGMWVQWRTGLETNNVGFVLLRQDWMQGKNGRMQWSRSYRLHPSLIAGAAAQGYANADAAGGFGYGWKDVRPLPKSLKVRYILVDVDSNNKTKLHGPAVPVPAQGSLASRTSSKLLTQLGR